MQHNGEFRPVNIPIYGVPARKYNCFVNYDGRSYYDREHVKMNVTTKPVNIIRKDNKLNRTIVRIDRGFLP